MFQNEDSILKHGGMPTPTAVFDQTNHSVMWKQCLSCTRVKPYGQFRRDASYREGVRNQCIECEAAPRLSTEEHTYRLRESNFDAAASQRWGKDQLDFMDEDPRINGRYMHHSDFLSKLRNINKSQLYIRDGNFVGDLAIYKVWNRFEYENGNFYSRYDPDKPTFQYICYLPLGYSPEYSIIEFDERAVPIREAQRGYRTVLLRLIKAGIVTEKDVLETFGDARGPAAIPFKRDLYRWRNRR